MSYEIENHKKQIVVKEFLSNKTLKIVNPHLYLGYFTTENLNKNSLKMYFLEGKLNPNSTGQKIVSWNHQDLKELLKELNFIIRSLSTNNSKLAKNNFEQNKKDVNAGSKTKSIGEQTKLIGETIYKLAEINKEINQSKQTNKKIKDQMNDLAKLIHNANEKIVELNGTRNIANQEITEALERIEDVNEALYLHFHYKFIGAISIDKPKLETIMLIISLQSVLSHVSFLNEEEYSLMKNTFGLTNNNNIFSPKLKDSNDLMYDSILNYHKTDIDLVRCNILTYKYSIYSIISDQISLKTSEPDLIVKRVAKFLFRDTYTDLIQKMENEAHSKYCQGLMGIPEDKYPVPNNQQMRFAEKRIKLSLAKRRRLAKRRGLADFFNGLIKFVAVTLSVGVNTSIAVLNIVTKITTVILRYFYYAFSKLKEVTIYLVNKAFADSKFSMVLLAPFKLLDSVIGAALVVSNAIEKHTDDNFRIFKALSGEFQNFFRSFEKVKQIEYQTPDKNNPKTINHYYDTKEYNSHLGQKMDAIIFGSLSLLMTNTSN